MKIHVNLAAFKRLKSKEMMVRFVLGGASTAVAGVIATIYGPVVGGLFLAFPAIFPASITLVEQHEITKKAEKHLNGRRRGRQAAGADATGAIYGSVGMAGFGLTVWLLSSRLDGWVVLGLATVVWLTAAALLWLVRQHLKFRK